MLNTSHVVVAIFLLLLNKVSAKSDTVTELYKIGLMIKECISRDKHPSVCLKERALEALNQTLYIDEPITIGFLRVEKNPEYDWNSTSSDALPEEIEQRGLVLDNALYNTLKKFFSSRIIMLNVDEVVEGRKKGGGGDGGGGKGGGKGVMMMMGAAAACVGAGMMVGKMGMMAMAALMLSKISLLLSIIMLLKKSKGGGGGDEKEKQIKIFYTPTGGGGGDYGKGGGGGGGGSWHRSISDPQTMTYRAHIPQEVNANVIYEGV